MEIYMMVKKAKTEKGDNKMWEEEKYQRRWWQWTIAISWQSTKREALTPTITIIIRRRKREGN